MAKLTLNDITAGNRVNSALNENFADIEDAVENTLSRDGTTPNQMEADLDMNSNDLLNLNSLDVQTLTIAGTPAVPSALAGEELPAQAGHGDKFLQTSGSITSWQIPDATEITYTPPGASSLTLATHLNNAGVVIAKDFGATGDGATDDTTAIDAALTYLDGQGGGTLLLGVGEFLVDDIEIPEFVYVVGLGRGATILTVTGTGGGAPGTASNGGVRIFKKHSGISDLTLNYTNASLECLLNVSHATGLGRVQMHNVDMQPDGSLSATDIDCLAVYLENLVEFYWKGGQIGQAPNFKQDMQIHGYFNGCKIEQVTFRPHAVDFANSVYHDINHLLDLNASCRASVIDNCILENGPNGILNVNQGELDIIGTYMGDGHTFTMWLPSTAYSLGDGIFPSASVTGDATASSADLTSVSDTSNLYVNQRIVVIGAGAAGANLDTRITAISGTTVTMDDSASTTAATAGIYYPDYSGYGYRCTVAGTSGATAPTFGTTVGGTTADNSVTWMNYDSCAWVDNNTRGGRTGRNTTNIRGGYIGDGICALSAIRSGSTPGYHEIMGTTISNQAFPVFANGVGALNVACTLRSYDYTGITLKGTGGACRDNRIGPIYKLSTPSPADDVNIATNSNNMGGTVEGSVNVSGIGAGRFRVVETLVPSDQPREIKHYDVAVSGLSAIGANTTGERSITLTGLHVDDTVLSVEKPSHQTGLSLSGSYRVTNNTIYLTFQNSTAGSITPTDETYRVTVARSHNSSLT